MDDTVVDGLFKQRQGNILMDLLPVVIVTVVLVFIGVVGNILTLVFYIKKSKHPLPIILIICLAAADLATCTVAVTVIPEMIANIGYTDIFLCKFTHFIAMWSTATSCLFLWIITIDRYRKICTPLGRQITISSVKYIAIGIITFTLLLATRLLFTYDIFEVNVTLSNANETITTYYCSASDHGVYKQIGLVFYIVDFLLFMMIFVTIVITYSRIIYKLHKRRKLMDRSARVKLSNVKKLIRRRDSFTNLNNSNKDGDKISGHTESEDAQSVKSQSLEIAVKESKTAETKVTVAKPKREAVRVVVPGNRSEFTTARRPSERILTIMMFAISVLFLLCFTPYFVLRILIRLVLNTDKEFDFGPGIQFALMLPFFNSVFNPVIYTVFNPIFRRFIKILFLKCLKYTRH